MILLKNGTLTPRARFTPESMSLTITERDSSASLSLGPEAPDIAVGDWMQDDTDPGKGIVWRVRAVNQSFDTRTRTVTLEHILQTLKDSILFGEITGSAMGGSDENCSAQSAAQYVMRQQSLWRLGSFEYPAVSAGYSFNGDTLFAALETICTTLDGCWWEYDLTRIPFTLHIRKAGSAVMSEMRAGRNIVTLRHTIDRSRMYTRIYPVGENNLHLSGDYIEKNTALYGVVSKTETDQSIGSEDMLRRWAQDRLNRHCEPTVTIDITGLELSRATGESLDRLIIGTRCRVPLPEYGTTITERITKLYWRDKIREPENVNVTLANNEEDLARIISQEVTGSSSTAARGGRAGAKKAEEDHAWFVDTTDHVSMVAEAVAGPGAAENWSRVAEITVDGKGIHQHVTEAEGEIVKHQASIEANERSIQQEVIDRSREDAELSGRIKVQADRIDLEIQERQEGETKLYTAISVEAGRIRQEVSNTESRLAAQIAVTDSTASMSVGRVKYTSVRHYANRSSFPATGSAGTLYYDDSTGKAYLYMPGTASYELAAVDEYGNANYIKAGEIAISINESGNTEAKIDADVIYAGRNTKQTLAGLELPDWMNTTDGLIADHVTALSLHAQDIRGHEARLDTIETDYLMTKDLSSEIGKITGVLKVAHLQAQSYTWTPSSGETKALTAAYDTVEKTVNGNDITLTFTKINGSTDSVTFSRATSLSGAWSGDTLTVTARPQNENFTIGFSGNPDIGLRIVGKTGEYVWTDAQGNANYNYLYKPVAVGTTNPSGPPTERTTADILVDASLSYNQGKTDGGDAISKPSVTYTNLGATTLGGVSGKASISNKSDGTARSTDILLTLEKTTYTPSAAVGAQNCVVVKTSGGTVVGRIDIGQSYDSGYVAGWNAARAKVTRDGDTIYRPKARTASDGSSARTTENETAFVANYTASSHSNSRHASAEGYYQIGTTGTHKDLSGSSNTGSYGMTLVPKNDVTAGVYIYIKPAVSGADSYTPSSFSWTDS